MRLSGEHWELEKRNHTGKREEVSLIPRETGAGRGRRTGRGPGF